MKFIFKAATAVSFTAMAILCQSGNLFAQVQAPDPTQQTQEFDIKIDNLGDANYEFSQKMNQAQWENFKTGPLVNDPSISKRNLERSMSTVVLEDFNRTIDDMNRTVKMTFKVKAAAEYHGNGNWDLKLFSKNPQITKLADNSYMLTSNTYIGTQLTQQIMKVYFPNGASNIQQTTDSFGKAVFTYQKGGGFLSYFAWNNLLGGLLIIVAIVLLVRQQKPQQLTLLETSPHVSPPPPNLPHNDPPEQLTT